MHFLKENEMENRKWYHKEVIYQVYPASFRDSNGDGIGDLNGITEKLPYLKSLGIHTVWLNPIFASPMVDNGYDVSDYYQINPMFGTMEDFDRMVETGKQLGIRFILDMVVNHCSDQHEWFQKALRDPEGPYGKYFFFRKGENGNPPNNWRSIFGGSVWEKVPGSDYYYLHVFAKEQVDLNWDCREMREQIYDMMNWWLDKGIAGFRLDAITYIKKQPGLPSYPADAPDGLCSPNYGSLNVSGIGEILAEIRDRTYGRKEIRDQVITIGEVGGVRDGELPKFISQKDGYFSTIFEFSLEHLDKKAPNFFWFDLNHWTAEEFKATLFEKVEATEEDCWYLPMLEGHDLSRMIDRMLPKEGQNFYGASMLGLLNVMRPGSALIYQGMELGMRNNYLPTIDDYADIQTKEEYRRALEYGYDRQKAWEEVTLQSRDHSRMPFPWNESKNSGFSDADKTWLPANPNYPEVNAEREMDDPDSLWSWYKEMIRLRTNSEFTEVLTYGKFIPCYREKKNVIAFERSDEAATLLIILNFQDKEISLELEGAPEILMSNYRRSTVEPVIALKPFEALLLRR